MNSEVFLFAIRCRYLCSNHWNAIILEHILKYSREKIHVDYILQYLIGWQLVLQDDVNTNGLLLHPLELTKW